MIYSFHRLYDLAAALAGAHDIKSKVDPFSPNPPPRPPPPRDCHKADLEKLTDFLQALFARFLTLARFNQPLIREGVGLDGFCNGHRFGQLLTQY